MTKDQIAAEIKETETKLSNLRKKLVEEKPESPAPGWYAITVERLKKHATIREAIMDSQWPLGDLHHLSPGGSSWLATSNGTGFGAINSATSVLSSTWAAVYYTGKN